MKKKAIWIAGSACVVAICALAGVFCKNNIEKKNRVEEKTELQSMFMQKDSLQQKGQLCQYYQKSDGTWSADGKNYQRKIVLTGKLPSAETTTVYVVLTNEDKITFEEIGKSFYSSDSADWLNPEKTCVVQCFGTVSQNTIQN